MANDVFSYDEATADTAFGSLGSVASGLQGNLDDLTGFVNRVRANWEGDEMDLYDSIQQRRRQLHAEVGEAAGGEHQMDPVREPARGDVTDDLGQVLVLGLERRIVVHDEHDVGGRQLRQPAGAVPEPHRVGRVEVVLGEQSLPPVELRGDLAHGPAYAVGL